MRVSTNARRGRDLGKPLGSEWFPGIPPERKRRAAIRFIVFTVISFGGGIAIAAWLIH